MLQLHINFKASTKGMAKNEHLLAINPTAVAVHLLKHSASIFMVHFYNKNPWGSMLVVYLFAAAPQN